MEAGQNRTRTVAEKIRLVAERNRKLRLEKFERGKPFMHFSSLTPKVCYYEYSNGKLEIWQLDTNVVLHTLTGEQAADALAKLKENPNG